MTRRGWLLGTLVAPLTSAEEPTATISVFSLSEPTQLAVSALHGAVVEVLAAGQRLTIEGYQQIRIVTDGATLTLSVGNR